MMRWRPLLALALGSLALSSCSLVPTASAPQRLSGSHIPFGLLNRSIPGTNGGRVRFITQPVYIVDATGHLAPSSRIVPSPPDLVTVLRQLIQGPTAIERAAGYSSALPKNLVVISGEIKNSVAYIDLATPLSSLPPSQQILAVGQIVMTANDIQTVNSIQISVGGEVQLTLLPNGTRARLVSVNDFQRLLNA